VPAADGVDARARRVAARLLSTRARRSAPAGRRSGDVPLPGSPSSPRHLAGGHPAGAARLAKTLKALEADGWVSLAQVQRPGAPGGPRIDHVVIGPGGVLVVESAPWVGRIEVSRGVVQQNGFWREQETAAVAQAAGCLAALLLPQHRTAVHAFICIAQHDLAEHLVSPGVHVVGVTGLARSMRALPQRLHPAEVLHLNTVLRHTLVDTEAPEQLTTAELDNLPQPGDLPGAHREAVGLPIGPGLFVPMTGSSLRSAARSARSTRSVRSARRQRARPPWWRTPRVLVPRALLAVLLLVIALIVGPGVIRSVVDSVGGTPAPTVLPGPAGSGMNSGTGNGPMGGSIGGAPGGQGSPGGAGGVPGGVPGGRPGGVPDGQGPTGRGTVVAPTWSGSSAPIQPAATAQEPPRQTVTPSPADLARPAAG
jgi:Nuclease-related domain